MANEIVKQAAEKVFAKGEYRGEEYDRMAVGRMELLRRRRDAREHWT